MGGLQTSPLSTYTGAIGIPHAADITAAGWNRREGLWGKRLRNKTTADAAPVGVPDAIYITAVAAVYVGSNLKLRHILIVSHRFTLLCNGRASA